MQSPTEPDRRQARKLRDHGRWSRPLVTRRDRMAAWASMLIADHGLFRLVWPNYHWMTPRAARAAQPSPGLLRRFAREGGRSVVSLRGGLMFGSLPLEAETCRALGLAFIRIRVKSRQLPAREDFRTIVRTLRSVEPPVLYHCKSGADRVGFVAVLHMHLVEGLPLREALAQLSLRFGHVRQARTGILDHFFESYLAEAGDPPLPLETWVETRYDPARIAASFRPSGLASLVVDRVLGRE